MVCQVVKVACACLAPPLCTEGRRGTKALRSQSLPKGESYLRAGQLMQSIASVRCSCTMNVSTCPCTWPGLLGYSVSVPPACRCSRCGCSHCCGVCCCFCCPCWARAGRGRGGGEGTLIPSAHVDLLMHQVPILDATSSCNEPITYYFNA